MKIIQGFAVISQFVNNTPGQTASVGELSTWSRTYSKEKGDYRDATVPGYQFVSFRSVDNTTTLPEVVSSDQALEILEVIRDIVAYATANLRPYDPVDFRNTVLNDFFGRISGLELGEFVDNGTIALPEYASWVSTANNNNEIKVWMSDAAFADQYSEYSITVIPPVTPIDLLQGNYQTAVDAINARTVELLGDAIQTAKDVNPETYVRMLTFDLINRLNPALTTKTTWAVLIYGKNGDNIDSIKDAIVDSVLSGSAYTRAQWEEIMPDLFKRTEFVLYPRWDLESIPNLTSLSGLYSSMVEPTECVQFAVDNTTFYTPVFVQGNVKIFPYPYKAVMLVSVNGENNVTGKRDLKLLFPDYIPVPSTSVDFARMQLVTREWLLFLDDLIIAAETATLVSTLPSAFRRTIRDNKLFISAIHNSINYLVAARSNSFYS